jgi:ABC-type amino acid transport substrate-binding protein
MKRVIFAVIVAIIAAGVFSACAKKRGGNQNNIVKVVFGEGNKPKAFHDENGKPSGYEVEVFEELDKLWDDITLEFDMMNQTSALLGVETGKYQIGSSGLFKNPPREEKFLFPRENLYYSPLNLVIKGDSTINSFEDMRGKTFTPMQADVGTYFILEAYIKAHPEGNYTLNTIDRVVSADSARWIAEGRYDAWFTPGEPVPPIKEALGLDIKLSDIVYYEPTYPIFNKANADLVERYNTSIKILRENGTLSRLAVKWLGTDVFADQAAFAARSR